MAWENKGLEFPFEGITINLQPASLRKRGTNGLAIAMSILSAKSSCGY